jgi:hypothetical protein
MHIPEGEFYRLSILKRFSIGLGVDYLWKRFGAPTEVYITQAQTRLK